MVFVDIDIIKPTIHFEQLIWLDKFEPLIEYNKIDNNNFFLLPIGCGIFTWSGNKKFHIGFGCSHKLDNTFLNLI